MLLYYGKQSARRNLNAKKMMPWNEKHEQRDNRGKEEGPKAKSTDVETKQAFTPKQKNK